MNMPKRMSCHCLIATGSGLSQGLGSSARNWTAATNQAATATQSTRLIRALMGHLSLASEFEVGKRTAGYTCRTPSMIHSRGTIDKPCEALVRADQFFKMEL
jgi:hypothetical protein